MLDDDKLMSVSEYLELPTARYIEAVTKLGARIYDSTPYIREMYVGEGFGGVTIENLYFEEKQHAIQAFKDIATWLEGK